MTVTIAKQLSLLNPKDKSKGYFCDCCGMYVKSYVRRMNCNMALTLIHLYKQKQFGFVHVEKFLTENKLPRSGDFHKLTYWKMLETLPEKRSDGSPRNGYYKLTGLGIMFVEGKTTAKESIVMFNNKFMGFGSEKEITIQQALGKRFSFDELMNNG